MTQMEWWLSWVRFSRILMTGWQLMLLREGE